MKARVLFGAGGFAFVLLALYVFPPILLEVVLTLLCVLAAYEFLHATGMVENRQLLFLCCSFAFLLGGETILIPEGATYQPVLSATIALYAIALFCVLLRFHKTISLHEISAGTLGGFVIPFMLLSLLRIFHMENGAFLVLLPLVAAWGSDTCALFTGVLIGKHKLAPEISPKKTVEGAIGGTLGAALLMVLAVFLLDRYTAVHISWVSALILGAVGAAIGQIGDLAFSIIKRKSGIKDYGNIFPGHGGVLDRFDSVIFVAPIVELILQMV